MCVGTLLSAFLVCLLEVSTGRHSTMYVVVFLGFCEGSSWFAVMAELELKTDGDSPEPKKPMVTPKIGTHNGTFHCDEALACLMLKQLPEYKYADIVRTRNPEELSKCDVVVDVGGVYDADKHRYDHHQRYVIEASTADAAVYSAVSVKNRSLKTQALIQICRVRESQNGWGKHLTFLHSNYLLLGL